MFAMHLLAGMMCIQFDFKIDSHIDIQDTVHMYSIVPREQEGNVKIFAPGDITKEMGQEAKLSQRDRQKSNFTFDRL